MRWSLLPLVLLLAACDPTPPPEPETQPVPAFEAQVQALKRARAVEKQVMDSAQAQREQIDEAAQQ